MAAAAATAGKEKEEDKDQVRVVRCPKCGQFLPELAGYSVYACGGCGATLQAKRTAAAPSSSSKALLEIKYTTDSASELVGAEKSSAGAKKEEYDAPPCGTATAKLEVTGDTAGVSAGEAVRLSSTSINDSLRRGRHEVEGEWPASGGGRPMPAGRYITGEYSTTSGSIGGAARVAVLERNRAELLRMLDELRDQVRRSGDLRHGGAWLEAAQTAQSRTALQSPFIAPSCAPASPAATGHQSCSCFFGTAEQVYSHCHCLPRCPYPTRLHRGCAAHMADDWQCGCPPYQCHWPANPIGHPRCEPVGGAAPFMVCANCFEAVQLPPVLPANAVPVKLRCGSCSHCMMIRPNIDSHHGLAFQNLAIGNVARTPSLLLGDRLLGRCLSEKLIDGEGSGKGSRSTRSEQEKGVLTETFKESSIRDVVVAAESELVSDSSMSWDTVNSSEHDEGQHRVAVTGKWRESSSAAFLAGIIKKGLGLNGAASNGEVKVFINGHPITDRAVRKAERLAGRVDPGQYWYDYHAGFWGPMGQSCVGIVPPGIEEFKYPMPRNCAGGNTGVIVNGRELHQKDLDLLAGRGLPDAPGRSYRIDISGNVTDESSGEEFCALGKLAPTVEKMKRGFGMRVRPPPVREQR